MGKEERAWDGGVLENSPARCAQKRMVYNCEIIVCVCLPGQSLLTRAGASCFKPTESSLGTEAEW